MPNPERTDPEGATAVWYACGETRQGDRGREQRRYATSTSEPDWRLAPLSTLLKHLEARQADLSRAVGRIERMLETLAHHHGDDFPELLLIRNRFRFLAQDLAQHVASEDDRLFPCIVAMERQRANGDICDPLPFGGLGRPIRESTAEHERMAETLRAIREYSNDYTIPRGACLGYFGLYELLKEFDQELHKCMKLEDEVLFPHALQLQERRIKPPSGASGSAAQGL